MRLSDLRGTLTGWFSLTKRLILTVDTDTLTVHDEQADQTANIAGNVVSGILAQTEVIDTNSVIPAGHQVRVFGKLRVAPDKTLVVDGSLIVGTPIPDRHYVHIQNSPSSYWVITHNLHKYPSVSIVDSAGTAVVGDVTYESPDTLTVSFVSGFGGRAYLN